MHLQNLSTKDFELGLIFIYFIYWQVQSVLDEFNKYKPQTKNYKDRCKPLIDTYNLVENNQYLYLKIV